MTERENVVDLKIGKMVDLTRRCEREISSSEKLSGAAFGTATL